MNQQITIRYQSSILLVFIVVSARTNNMHVFVCSSHTRCVQTAVGVHPHSADVIVVY